MRAQVGQINVNSSLFSGAPINGVQLIPEQGLAQDTQGVTINGIARTHGLALKFVSPDRLFIPHQ